MKLDINTRRGQSSLRYEKKMIDKINDTICKKHKNSSMLIETDKNMDSKIDGIIIKNNQVSGVFESKCRNLSLIELQSFGSWLVTYDKIADGKLLSTMLRAPFIGFLYLIKDDIIMYWKITDKYGNFLFDYDVKETRTQRTINGGSIIRKNAFLPIKHGNKLL